MCNMERKTIDNIENGLNIEEEEDELETDDEEEEMDQNVGQVINVAFDAQPPSDCDFHGIKRLLQQLFIKSLNEELSELTTLIISQDFIGSVLKQDEGEESEDDEDDDSDEDDDDRNTAYSLCTVVNLSQNQSLSCIEKINEYLGKKCEENHAPAPKHMVNLLSDPSKQVGLIISERFINIPPQVALPSYESLKGDIEKAVRKKKKFNFTHLVLISKTYRAKEAGKMGTEMFYTNPEEQLFNEICEFQYTFSVADQRDSISGGNWDEDGGDMESLRNVMVFDASALGHMIDKLRAEISAT